MNRSVRSPSFCERRRNASLPFLNSFGGSFPSSRRANVNLFHAGIAYKIESGSLFVLQPAVTYQMKGANITSDTNGSDFIKSLETKTGFAELSLGLQVGLDLLAFRPYVFAEPFVG